ncbi:MAG: bifunctional hydroxymethylpyrimidine kinase/phosphomethylpyrimidine kinase, partial [Oscillospiraceae bacterium]|nr:bifunctional hydroxymethylpyrimidine kinase/phosphomethylpyrimidine kinase [Oscillospiraceae bacterium]
MEKQKRVAAIHDLSGYGRCALTVILPVISAMGIQCVTVPTAVLSTHTGGFSNFILRDTTDFISPCCRHYKELDVHFDAIYSGFLASEEQADCCLEFFESFPDALKIVDPVMGDDGTAYQTYTKG